MYKRYRGNSGQSERVPEPEDRSAAPPPPPPRPEPKREQARVQTPSPAAPAESWFGALLHRLAPGALETEDLLIAAILYLLYRESGDREYLLMLGAYLFF